LRKTSLSERTQGFKVSRFQGFKGRVRLEL